MREPTDFYRTPGWAVRALLPYLPPWREGMVVVDAGAGDGAIAGVLVTTGKYREVICVETNPVHCAELRRPGEYDVREETWATTTAGAFHADLVVSNPPFSDAMDFVLRARGCTLNGKGEKGIAAFLLRLPWLASQSRAAFHRANPAHILVLPRRPSFTADRKTDATDYAWFVWGTTTPASGASKQLVPGHWDVLEVEGR